MGFNPNEVRDQTGKWASTTEGQEKLASESFQTSDGTRWPGQMSEYTQENGNAEILANQVEKQMTARVAPIAQIYHPASRLQATQSWLSREQGGGDPVFPEFEDKHGKLPIIAKTPDGGLHILDGHHTIFYQLKAGKSAVRAFVFKVPGKPSVESVSKQVRLW